MTDIQALIGKPFRMEFARKLVNSKRHHLPPHMQVDALDEIDRLTAALTDAEAKLAKAREGLEKIAGTRTVKFDGSEPFSNIEIARACLAKLGEV